MARIGRLVVLDLPHYVTQRAVTGGVRGRSRVPGLVTFAPLLTP
jgi:hypothetical protein